MSGEPIALYQSFLDQPEEAIVAHIQIHFQRELQLHKIKKQAEEALTWTAGKQKE